MKKILCLVLIGILLVLTLTSCSSGTQPEKNAGQVADFNPETTSVPNPDALDVAGALIGLNAEDIPIDEVLDKPLAGAEETIGPYVAEPTVEPTEVPSEAPVQNPTEEPAEAAATSDDFSNYRFETLADTSMGFTFAYPTAWQFMPGKSTVCFREIVEEGDVPARVAVTKKKLVHTPSEKTIINQFVDYAATVRAQYDAATFEFGTPNYDDKFMKQKKAYSITYLAYSGETEVKGYMIICAIENYLYVFHFSASYKDYVAMQTIMERMRDSVALVEK